MTPFKHSGIAAALLTLALAACGTAPGPCPPLLGPDKAYVISETWHSEIAIPVSELDGSLQPLAAQFPGAQMLLFGYGKQGFMTAPPGSLAKYVTGPFPGDAAIEVTALDVDPASAYPPDAIVTLALPPGGAQSLSAYIRGDMTNNPDGTLFVVEHWHDPETLFIAANSEYTFLHTCNKWVAIGLVDAGVPLSSSRVFTSGRLMDRAKEAASQCEAAKPG